MHAIVCLLAQIITEIHPVPAAGEPEWVEIYNPTGRTKVLKEHKICDSRSCVTLPDVSIPSRSYVVITTSRDALLESRSVNDVVQSALPSLNNTTDVVELRDADSSLIDRCSYNMKDHVKGRTIERRGRWVDDDVVHDTTWATCVANDSATCGTLNSVVTLKHDLAITPITVDDRSIIVGVRNVGQNVTDRATLFIRLASSKMSFTVDRLPPASTSSTQIFTVGISDLGWPQVTGRHACTMWVNIRDDRSANDSMIVMLDLPPPAGSIVLNEIMFDPWPGEEDYVELINIGSDTVDLSNWIIEDGSGDRSNVNAVIRLPPDSMIAMMGGVNLKPDLSLNAGGDRVVIRTPSGFLVDDVQYDPSWHSPMLPNGKGVSLEKRSPQMVSASAASWTSSGALSGGTPGAANTMRTPLDLHTQLTASPSPFSADPADARHPCIIAYQLPFQQAIITLHVRRWDGTYIATLLNSVFTGSEAAVAWDGTTATGLRIPPGAYVAVLEAVDAASRATYRSTCSVIVGE